MNILPRTTKVIIAFIAITVFSSQGYADEQQPTSSSTLERDLASIAREGTDTQTKILIDGTTIMPGPGSSYSIKSFPETLSDDSNIEMVIVVNRGLVRVIGGYLNYNAPIIILTPSAKLTLEKADVIVSVDENSVTRASMVYGKSLTMESGGSQEVIVKPGFELVSESAGSPPKAARKQEKDVLIDTVTAPESWSGSNYQEGATGNDADVILSSDGGTIPAATDDDKVSDPLPNTSVILPPFTGSGSGSAGGSLLIGLAADISDSDDDSLGQFNGDIQGAHQELECCDSLNSTGTRTRGLSTNRLYTSHDRFTQMIEIDNLATNPQALGDSSGDEQANYEFINDNASDPQYTIVIELDNSHTPQPIGSAASADSGDAAVILNELNEIEFSKDDNIFPINSKPTNEFGLSGNRFSSLANYMTLSTGFQVANVVTPSQPGGITDLVTRDPENFVIVEVHSLDTGHDNERYIFASGDVRSDFQSLNNISVDQFFLSAGLNNYNQKTTGVTRASDMRAFARDDSVINKNLGSLSDSGLLVVNHDTISNQPKPTRVLHADFSLVGTGPNQTSTISTTLGTVEYKTTRFADPVAGVTPPLAPSPDGANDVEFNAATLGSTQGAAVLSSFNSEVFNTSAGGGLDTLGSGPGYADYFVLENYAPPDLISVSPSLVISVNEHPGGTEHAIGTESSIDQQYAFLRLASIQSSTPESELSRTQNSSNGGYAAGLVKTETGNNSLSIDYLLSGADPGTNLSITNDLTSSGLSVDINFNNGQSLSLGGSDNNATFVDDDRFAATNGSATLVSAGLVESGIDPAIASKINVPEYMQWGFFFGDVDVSATGTSHAHLASWVAGSVPSAADLPVSGSATYTGSAIGNVFAGANSYVAAGTYTNTWDFAARTGTAQLQEFDGVNYNGITALENNSSQFVGALANGAGSREVGLQGSFVQNAGDAAAGVMGQFYIQNTDSDVYRAAGTFAADRQ